MSWVTIIWSMETAACLTLAGIHLFIWARQRAALANFFFTLTALSVAGIAAFEFLMMRAQTPAEVGALGRWWHIPIFLAAVGIIGFIQTYLRTGRPWFAWGVLGLRTMTLVINFLSRTNINYLEINTLSHPTFLGETISVAHGVVNPWSRFGEVTVLLVVAFVVDASLTLWRRGNGEERRRAAVMGGSMSLFLFIAVAQTLMVRYSLIQSPYMVSFAFLFVVIAMGYELSRDVLRAAQLSDGLRESEERMTLATEAAQFGVWGRNLAHNQIWGSVKWRHLFGFAAGEEIDFEKFIERIHPDDRQMVRRALKQAQEETGDYAVDYRLILPDGSERWIASRGRVVANGSGKPDRMMGASLDITRRKQSELQIEQHRNEVAHLSRVTTLGEISGSLAHELNQPLGAILVNTEAVELHLQSPTPDLDEVRRILADIRKEDLRAGDIIHGMRAFLRRKELEMRPLEVGQMAEEVVKLIRTDAAANKTSVGLEIPAGLPPVTGDRVHLQQVLLNLLVNAMDAMNTCPVADRRITIRATRPDAHTVEIAVSDAGIGIPPGELDRLFVPFHTTKQGGLGLGLSICRSIIEAHGGSISITNNSDRGTTARFSLRACAPGQTA